MDTNKIDTKYFKAKDRVKKLKSFYSHIISYVVLIPFWIFINYKTSWNFKWFWIPVIIMGISILIHAFKLFGYSNDWEERKLKEFMENDNL